MKDYEELASELARLLKETKESVAYYEQANRMHRVFYHDECRLYVMHSRANGLVKVGITGNIEGRQSALSRIAGEPLDLITTRPVTRDKAYRLEASAHQALSEYRYRGEWFHDDCLGDILAIIDEVSSDFEARNLDMFDLYHMFDMTSTAIEKSDFSKDIESIDEMIRYSKNVRRGLENTMVTDSNGSRTVWQMIMEGATV